jgi:predicted AAA+ superfamily ATPase
MEEKFNSLAKYNFWNDNVPQQGFLRTDYLNAIRGYCHNKLVKVIMGQRRTGKSYILRQIANDLINSGVHPHNIFYLNKEYIDFDFVNQYTDLEQLIKHYQLALKPLGKIYLFLDEIQNIVQWERLVNSYSQDFTESYEVFISGSNSKMLSGELATLLSGRYVNFEIFPFSFKEFSGITKQEINKETYLKYMQTGGLPELFVLPNEENKRHYVASVKDTVLLRDVIQRHAIKDPKLLEEIFIYLVNNAANLLSINNVTNYLKSKGRKTTYDTIANYIGYIEDTFLLHKAERFDIKGKDTIAGNVKYYCNDLAYKNYLYAGFGYGIGNQLENLIYLELRRSGYEVYVGVMPNKEVDFVATKADQKLYVQSTYLLIDEATIKREYASLEAISDNYPKIVVSLDDLVMPISNGIIYVQAWKLHDFLTNSPVPL